MKTFFFIVNNWNSDTLSRGGTWVNDGRDTTSDRATAERMMSDYLTDHPEDEGRLTVSSYDMAEEDLA